MSLGPRSLRARLASVLAALVAFVLLVNAAYLVWSGRQRLRERLETSATLFATLATGPLCSAYEAYFSSGYFKFRQVVRDLLASAPDVTSMEIVDVEGHVLFESQETDDEIPRSVPSRRLDPVRLEAARRLEPTVVRRVGGPNDALEIVAPWVEDWGRHRLSVVYRVSYANLEAEYRRYALATLGLTAVSILVAALVGLALANRLARPLEVLTAGAREIAEGRFGRLDVRTGDELETLGDAFNEMAARLEATRAERERLIAELGRRNAELSRVGRVIGSAETVSLEELAHEAVVLMQGRLRATGVRVDVLPGLPTVRGDRTRLREVLQNLIENAAKFRTAQAVPKVEVGCRQEPDGPVVFVRDNGVGIDPRYHERVFGLFERLDPRVEGTGVGLALVKRIVDFHGGRVWVESEGAGKGSTFCFTLAPPPSLSS